MSQYFKFTPSQNEFTTLRFIDTGAHELEVKVFDTNTVLIQGDQADIDALIAEQPAEIGLTEITFDEFFPLAAKSSQGKFFLGWQAKQLADAQDEINRYCPDREIATWPKQESEARAYLADNTVATPMLDAILASPNKWTDKQALAQRIIDKADYAAAEHGRVLGEYQAAVDSYFGA